MRRIKMLWVLVLCIGIAIPLYSVFAQSATNQTWTSEIAYFNTEDASGTLNISLYDSNGDVTSTDPVALSPHQSGTLLIGSLSGIGSDFSGSAVMSADVQIAAVYIEFVSGAESDNYDRKIYTGFFPGNASNIFYVPTVLKKAFGATSQVGIQNVNSSLTAPLKLEFFVPGETDPTYTDESITLDPQSAYIFSMNDYASLPDGFSGSLKITSTGGEIVASSEETWDDDRFAYSFEGVASGETKVYVPTMLCRFGPGLSISYYALQAVGGEANIIMRHYDRNTGSQVGEDFSLPAPLPDGGKASLQPCRDGGVPDGSIGSSVIESTGAPIIVTVKVADESGGIRTAFVGQGTGATQQALPYVRWNADTHADFLSYIAVMNIGESDATDVNVYYFDSTGTLVATHTLADPGDPGTAIAPLLKKNTNAVTAGALDLDGNFAGAVIVTSDQPVLVTVRAAKEVSDLGIINMFAEDYTGIPITP
jgi:hypothetical protein